MFKYFDHYDLKSKRDQTVNFTGRTGCISRYFFRRSNVRVRSQNNYYNKYTQLK